MCISKLKKKHISGTSTPVNDAIPGPSTEHVQQPVLMDNSFVSEQVMEEDISQESSILLCSPEQKGTTKIVIIYEL